LVYDYSVYLKLELSALQQINHINAGSFSINFNFFLSYILKKKLKTVPLNLKVEI